MTRGLLGPGHLDDRQREPQPQLVSQIDFDVVQSVLLKLHPAKVMDVGGVPFHFLEDKFHFGLGDDLRFVHADNARFLPEFSRTAAPACPDTKPHIIYRQSRGGNNIDHADKRLHAVEFAANVFTQHTTLQIREHDIGFHGRVQIEPRANSTNMTIPRAMR